MTTRYYYLITALPALPELTAPPSLTPAGLRERLAAESFDLDLADAVLLEDDLLIREGVLAGEIPEEKAEGAVLTKGQVRAQEPLPEALRPQDDSRRRSETDALWDTYYRYAADLGRQHSSEFLTRWVGYEVALRNALVVARAARLDLDEQNYLVAADLATALDGDIAETVAAWESAPDPLSAQHIIDSHRWDWVLANAGYFSFGLDELLAYTRRLSLATRWARIASRQDSRQDQ